MDLKKLTAYARMSRSAVPKLFSALPNLSLVNTPQTTYEKNNDCIGDF